MGNPFANLGGLLGGGAFGSQLQADQLAYQQALGQWTIAANTFASGSDTCITIANYDPSVANLGVTTDHRPNLAWLDQRVDEIRVKLV